MQLALTLFLATLSPLASFYLHPTFARSVKSSSLDAKLKISKYHGLGNDFILASGTKTPPLSTSQSAKLCDRNFGIGADGVIFKLDGDASHEFTMEIHNADGTIPEMCGNGIRTLAQYILDTSTVTEALPREMTIKTGAGTIIPTVTQDRAIIVDMGFPIFEAAAIPSTLAPNFADGGVVDQDIEVNGRTYKTSLVSMGNPHVVVFFDTMADLNIAFDLDAEALECHPAFPANANIEFVHVTSENHLTMKVFERGAGPTMACGTGACALTIAAVRAGKIKSATEGVTVTLPGGDLNIRWEGEGGKVWMTGPAQKVFEGEIETDDWL